jgi:hypothetical protein
VVSASAFSLRFSSRSSSLMRRRSALVRAGLARVSPGSASACVAARRHCSSSCGYTPVSRHQALLLASSIDAVTNTASNRAGPVQTRSRAGLDRASARHRFSVVTEMQRSRETVSTDALSGGSNRATALSLNACPYLATSFFRYRPQVSDSIEPTTILTQRGFARAGGSHWLDSAWCAGSAAWPSKPHCSMRADPPRRKMSHPVIPPNRLSNLDPTVTIFHHHRCIPPRGGPVNAGRWTA